MSASFPVGGIYSEVVFDLPSTASVGVAVPFKIVGIIYRLQPPQLLPPPPTFGVALIYLGYTDIYLRAADVNVNVNVGGSNYTLPPQSGNQSTVMSYTQDVELCTTVTLEGTITFPKAGIYKIAGASGTYQATGVPQEPYSFYTDVEVVNTVTVS